MSSLQNVHPDKMSADLRNSCTQAHTPNKGSIRGPRGPKNLFLTWELVNPLAAGDFLALSEFLPDKKSIFTSLKEAAGLVILIQI